MAENAFEAAVREFKTTTPGQFIWRLEEIFKTIKKLNAEEVITVYQQIPKMGEDFPGIAGLWFTERTRKAVRSHMKHLVVQCYPFGRCTVLNKRFSPFLEEEKKKFKKRR